MSKKRPNGLHCKHCNKPLVGSQRSYCSNAHRVAYNRAQAKARAEREEQEQQEREETEQRENADRFALMVQELAMQAGRVDGLESERARLSSKLDSSQSRVIELERENGVLEGKNSQLEQQLEAFETSGTPNYVTYFVGLLLLVAVIVLAVVATQAF